MFDPEMTPVPTLVIGDGAVCERRVIPFVPVVKSAKGKFVEYQTADIGIYSEVKTVAIFVEVIGSVNGMVFP
jgi:hypothetical protein